MHEQIIHEHVAYLAIFIPDHCMVPGQHLTVEDAVARLRSGPGDGAADFDRLQQGDVSLLEWVGVGLAGEDDDTGHTVPVRLAAWVCYPKKN